jgi:hypothetical protein
MEQNQNCNFMLYADGKYRWLYELDMWRNPTVFITVARVLGISAGAVGLFVALLAAGDGLMTVLKILGGFATGYACIMLLVAIAYAVVGLAYGGKYCVLFELDEKGVKHIQLEKQYDQAKALGLLTMLAGAAAGNLTAAGIGLTSASRQSMVSRFTKVKRIKAIRRRNVIYVSEPLLKNQVYVSAPEYDFVLNYITQRCGKARIKR